MRGLLWCDHLPFLRRGSQRLKKVATRGLLQCDHPQFFIRSAKHLQYWQLEDSCGATIRGFSLEVHGI